MRLPLNNPTRQCRPNRVRRAFTLIEILVVIVIIVIMAAIMVPVFVKAKAEAKKTTCISNLHQIALARATETGHVNLKCPIEGPRYSWAPEPPDPLADDLEMADPNHGSAVCALHGEEVRKENYGPSAYAGVVLRVRKDASVQRRVVPAYCMAIPGGTLRIRFRWHLFTDEPCPEKHCPSTYYPCK